MVLPSSQIVSGGTSASALGVRRFINREMTYINGSKIILTNVLVMVLSMLLIKS
jgi:hypothetical protein